MLKMKLPMRTAEEGGDDTAQDELEQPDLHILRSVSPSVPNTLERSPRQAAHPSQLDKETVFEWFGLHLNSAKRVEFMCGLLHMCQPLELRFLGSCLEDLARKDYHVLRDFENRANTPNDLGILSDVIDPVVRSKLLVCLSLLGSDSRECAGILFRILRHVDPASFCKNYDYSASFRDPHHHSVHQPCADGNALGKSEQNRMDAAAGPLEQLALLFTMASLHPAFPFHQRETIRVQLDKIELAIEEERQQNQRRINAQLQKAQKSEYLSPGVVEGSLGESRHFSQNPPSRRSQREAVHIEKIVLKGISGKISCKIDREYNFEVMWSNSSSSKVTKTHLELENFLLKLPKEQSTESFEKSILRLLSHTDKYESREVERTLKEKLLSAPQAFRQTRKVCSFFRYDSNLLCSRCSHIVLGKAYKEDCSEASSHEEDMEPYVQGQRKKHGSKSPSLVAKGSQGESRRAAHYSEANGQPEWRKRSCSLLPSQGAGAQDPEQDEERRSCKNKPRPHGPDGAKREGRAAFLTNGGVASPTSRRGRQQEGREGGVRSGQDMYGDMSSESYSSPSSPLRDGRESLDSEDEKNKDTDSHSDDSSKEGPDGSFFPHQQGAVLGSGTSIHPLSSSATKPTTEALGLDRSPQFPPLSFMHPYMVSNGAVLSEAPLPPPPPSQACAPDAKTPSGALIMPMPIPPVPSAVPLPGDPEKREVSPAVLPMFGAPSLGLHAPGSPALQPVVQRFKTAPAQIQPSEGVGTAMAPPAHQPPGQAYASPLQPAYPTPDPSPLSPALASSVPQGDLGQAKHPGLALPSGLPSGLPSPYTLPHIPTLGGAPSAGQIQTVQSVVPPAVPTHTPGPAPSPSPALTHSTAQSDSTSYINSTTCGNAGAAAHNLVSQQQALQQPQQQASPSQPQQQQQPMGCGACGCRGNCGGGGNATSHASFFFPPQMAPRQMFGVPPLFQLTSLCNSSYLTQSAQTNGAAQLPFFPSAAAPPPPYPPTGTLLHTHTHAHSDHVMGTQAAAAGYSLQQMAPFSQRFYQHIYPSTLGLVPGAAGAAGLGGAGVNKKNGIVSCYNCGVSGHYAQDCKQPSIDSSQQGGFRLKYAASHTSEALDNAD